MNKKVIGVILCIFIFGSIQVTGTTLVDDLDLDPEITYYVEQLLENENNTFGDYFFLTYGPVLNKYTTVKLLNGSTNQIERINHQLSRTLFRPGIILKYVPVIVENLSFTVEYKKDVRANSRYSHISGKVKILWNETTGEIEGFSDYSFVINMVHRVHVENMTGFFVFQRLRLYDITMPLFRKIFQPAKLWFFGFCENVTYL